jgi:ubiquinone/menaquinone biosynthesis C-methylase UbiE
MWFERRASSSIAGVLERPDRFQPFSRWVDVRGWVESSHGRPLLVEVGDGRSVLHEFRCPDSPAEPGARARFRFDAVVPLLTAPKAFWLTVTAVDPFDRSVRRVLGTSRMRRVAASDRTLPRASYGEVWNSVSRSLTDARFSVAGTDSSSEMERSGQSTALDVATETEMRQTDRVLEIGCGVGRVGAHIASRCSQWTGADVSQNMLRHAESALAGLPNVALQLLNGVDLTGIPDASLDVVYCTGVFMHLDEWERYRYIAEAWRVLVPGGRCYFDNIDLASAEGWELFSQAVRFDPLARPPNISKTSTAEELRTYAERAGLGDVRLRRAGLWITLLARKPPA